MACHEEHWFLLAAGTRRTSWRGRVFEAYAGWRAGGEELLNRLAVLSDSIGDWLWHVPPRSEAALQVGAAQVTADLAAGDEEAAALKAAFLSHYVVDPLAVAHAWLDYIGEREDFDSAEALHAVHDPVENVVLGRLDGVGESEPSAGDFGEAYAACLRRSYGIAGGIFRRWEENGRGKPRGEDYLDLCFAGIRNAAGCMPAFFDGLYGGAIRLMSDDEAQRLTARWPVREVLAWPAERWRAEVLQPDTVAGLRASLEWNTHSPYFEPELASEPAQADYAAYRRERAAWREGFLEPLRRKFA